MRPRRVIAVVLLVLLALTSPVWGTHIAWRRQPWRTEHVTLVNYSVPFVSAREHRGAAWLLNHEKYRSPVGERFAATGTHVGYDPTDREHPTPLAAADLSTTDWIVVADAYGVYVDDLRDIEHEQAHMDYSRKVFGGFSLADAEAIAAHTARGRHTLLEFNSIEEPTTPEARARLEALFGIHWTGWTGRTFVNLYDTTDVPHWLPRLYKERYGDQPMPKGPALVFVHRDGRLLLTSGRIASRVAPVIALTDSGVAALRGAKGGAHYYYWFPVLEAPGPGTVLAELAFPDRPESDSVLALAGIPKRIPMLTRRTDGGGHRLYLAADLADTDFDPGVYRFAGLAWLRAVGNTDAGIYESEVAFWQFYVPAVRRLLRAPFDTASPPR